MPNHNDVSEEAKWFLEKMQDLQDNFASAIGGQIVMTDDQGKLVTEMSGTQRVCQLIKSTEQGKKGCQESYQNALSLVGKQEEPVFMDCWAGFASLWVPVKIEGEIIGSITGCGGRFEKGKSKEELKEKYSQVAEDLGIEDKEDFVRAAVNEIEPVTQEEIQERAKRLASLVGVLVDQTALSEVFEV